MSEPKQTRVFLDITRQSAQNSGLFVRNDLKEFVERESEFLERGGKFIVPCPEFEIIGED